MVAHRQDQSADSARTRPPRAYFHNGSAQTLGDVLVFYSFLFSVRFNVEEETDLIAELTLVET
jgi:cytochrome c peroxidase